MKKFSSAPGRTLAKFNLGDAPVEVFCDRDKSFRVVDTRTMKTVALIPCDRSDLHDNARGLAIATIVEAAINNWRNEAAA